MPVREASWRREKGRARGPKAMNRTKKGRHVRPLGEGRKTRDHRLRKVSKERRNRRPQGRDHEGVYFLSCLPREKQATGRGNSGLRERRPSKEAAVGEKGKKKKKGKRKFSGPPQGTEIPLLPHKGGQRSALKWLGKKNKKKGQPPPTPLMAATFKGREKGLSIV